MVIKAQKQQPQLEIQKIKESDYEKLLGVTFDKN